VAAARKQGGPVARRAADVLEKWDRQANADSRGAILFMVWTQAYVTSPKAFATAWRLDSAITTPHGLADPAGAVKALEAAAGQVQTMYHALDVPWGDVVRIRYGGKDLPGNGAPGDPYGVFRTAYPAPDPDGKMHVAGGDTYYAAVEFGPVVRAKVLTAYGSATQLGSKHVGDQLELFAKQEMRDAWRSRTDIEAHLESKEDVP
jgi:acyl-homoserine-lactone acylase